jgi:hypothetical protein
MASAGIPRCPSLISFRQRTWAYRAQDYRTPVSIHPVIGLAEPFWAWS